MSERAEVEVGPVAHGGHCVARLDGRVVFVRHALPGERVVVELTDSGPGASYWRGDAVEVLEASPHRVAPPCPYAGPGRCGGCDWQHVELAEQRRLKAAVVEEQLRRLAGLDRTVEVEAVPGDHDGLGWRTRVQYAVGPDGRLGFRAHRSHQVVPVERCLIAHELVDGTGATRTTWPGRDRVEVAASVGSGETVVLAGRETGELTEHAAGREWRVAAGGFWQVHPGAAEALVAAVLDGLDPRPGDRALDLYAGVGLFAGALADRGVKVVAVEQDQRAAADARVNLTGLDVRVETSRVDRFLRRPAAHRHDLVVLDPPRSGAGKAVVESVSRAHPRAVAYVACDPAALARDLRWFGERGYALRSLRAFDIFPMTQHVEAVAVLRRAPRGRPAEGSGG